MVNSLGVNQRFAAGKIAEIGHGAGVNLELVLELETDVVMTVASAQSQYNAHPVLQQAGVAVAINAEYTEPSLLGRTEWLKFTAAFFNAEALAEKRFADIVAQYQQYAALVQDVPTDQRPTVFGGSLWRGHLARRRPARATQRNWSLRLAVRTCGPTTIPGGACLSTLRLCTKRLTRPTFG